MISSTMSTVKLSAFVVTAVLAVLFHLEVDNDILLVEKEVALPVTRAKMFMFLSDMRNLKVVNDVNKYIRWFPGVDSFEPIDSQPMGIGKHFTEIYHIPVYGDLEYDCIIMGYESPKHISYVCNGWMMGRIEMEVERNDSLPKYPTSMIWRMYSRRRSFLFSYILSPIISYLYGCTARQALFSLRYALQGP